MEAGSDMDIYCLAVALDHGYLDHGRMGKTEEEAEHWFRIGAEQGGYRMSDAYGNVSLSP